MATNAKKLYIGNLDPAVDEYAIVKLFEPYGKITFLDYLFHWTGPKKGLPRGYCFLEYDTRQQAINAIEALHRKVIKGRPLVVSFAFAHEQEGESKGQSSNRSSRPNAVTNLRAQKMANASTDAKINAIERKLATLQRKSTNQESRETSSAITTTSKTSKDAHSAQDSHHRLDTHRSHATSKRYRPY
ncbi:hypothetical protein LRAMOSA05828 [Lichtheimia ramosa]|uniref:Probable RNA-binding protein 18 n=1 Tax=Lichtheimia ramosa TaxID=688394 RepID=A0A077X3T1_9FUNG|nr:hypothetical protein LRAMOSA05828 [Lichtheimia ramosa]